MSYMDALISRADAERAAKETKLTEREAGALRLAAILGRPLDCEPPELASGMAKLRVIARGGGQ